jgi:WD40 repeat protein
LIGHYDYIFALTLLPNGLLASGSKDGEIMIWNVTKKSPLYIPIGHITWIRALTVINNEYLASCSRDKTIKLWSLVTYDEVRSWKASDHKLLSLAFNPKLNVLVSGGDDNKIKVWDSRLWTNITTKSGLFFSKYSCNLPGFARQIFTSRRPYKELFF